MRLEPAAEAFVFVGAEHRLERIAVAEVALHDGEALVAIELATVCGSDVHTVLGHRKVAVPQVLGHEQVGRIVALGPGPAPTTMDGSPAAVGDRVVWGVAVACGACAMCTRGLPNKCLHLRKYGHEQVRRGWELGGGIATHVHLLARTPIVRVPEDLPAEVLAPASCATATVAAVLEAAETVRPVAGERVLVSGCGMLGLTAIAMAREAGADVVAVDVDAARRALALEFGATEAWSPRDARGGFTVALELSGAGRAIEAIFARADVGATIVLAGSVFDAPPITVSAEAIVRRLLTVRGVHNYRPEHLLRAVRFLERADARLFARLVGDVVGFADAQRAFDEGPSHGVRVGIRP